MIESNYLIELLNKYHENKLAHAFLLETNNFEKCNKDLLILLKSINCPKEFKENCDTDCNICQLFDSNSLPSFISVYPDGQNIKKEQILDIMDKFSTIPLYTKFNMYVINNAEKFNASSANTILKFLEEPKPNILGFLITNNIENVIPTVRSRCEYIKCYYADEELKLDENYVNIVKNYLTSIFKKDNDIVFNKTNMVNTYTERSDYEKIFNTMLFFLKGYYEGNIEFKLYDGVKKNNISRMMILIENILKYIKSNVNIDLVLDKFVIEMRNYYE